MKTGVELIAAERKRQIVKEGWTSKHDDTEHDDFDLTQAATAYCLKTIEDFSVRTRGDLFQHLTAACLSAIWPWEPYWWKPVKEDPIRNLTKAGALIAAEIDRLQRDKRRGK